MKKIIFLISILVVVFSFSLNVVYAGTPNTPEMTGGQPACSGDNCFPNPLDPNNKGVSVETVIGRVIQAVLGVVGSLALLMFIYGGFTWMTASGNKEKVEKGKEIIIWATLGLVVIFTSYVLVRFVITSLTS